MPSNDPRIDARNNIFFNTQPGSNLAMLGETGSLTLSNNWAKTGWVNSHEGAAFTGTVLGGTTMITGISPGFADPAAQNFKLAAGSPPINAGSPLHPDVLTANNLLRQYVKHQSSEARPASGPLDLGAFEYFAATPLQITTPNLTAAKRTRFYEQTLQAAGGTGNITWAIVSGNLPHGIRLDQTTGRLYGRTRLRGSWTFTLEARDSQGTIASRQLSITSTMY